ncbi:MAG: RuBisCO large subunit C-terminal-like domain-containing protein [Burkholderiaceae bacterium]
MGDRLLVTYQLRCTAQEASARAHALAVEQSVEMPPEAIASETVRAHIPGRVEAIESDPDTPDTQRVLISLSAETVGNDPAQLLNMLFGNCALQPDVTLLDARLPEALSEALPGPRFGLDGWRAAIGPSAAGRPLSCTALKPQGLPPDELARLAYAFARAGIDVVKDDHGIADQPAAPFSLRVPAVQQAIERANREKARGTDPALAGHRTLYAPHVSGPPARIEQQLALIRDEGVAAVLACPMLVGAGSFAGLIRERAGVPLIAHPSFAGGRIAPPLLFGHLYRLFGADATIFPNWGGRFAYPRNTCLAIAEAARSPLGRHLPAMPVPAGGMRVDRCQEMLDAFGPDTMLLIGGDLLMAGPAMPARAAAFAAALRAARTDASVRRALSSGRWQGVTPMRYKETGAVQTGAVQAGAVQTGATPFRDVSRQVLFQLPELHCEWRYFEIAPGGHSTLERHQHAHAVMILRGRGRCLVGERVHEIGEHDLITIAPDTWHQFRAAADAPLGFLCLVNRERDRPRLPTPADLEQLRSRPEIAAFIRSSES